MGSAHVCVPGMTPRHSGPQYLSYPHVTLGSTSFRPRLYASASAERICFSWCLTRAMCPCTVMPPGGCTSASGVSSVKLSSPPGGL